MVFSSLQFVLLFMPIFFAVYYLIPARAQNFVLLLGSLVFYYVGTVEAPFHFVLFVGSMVMDFAVAAAMDAHPRCKKPLLVVGVLFHLICLCVFKYANFIFEELSNFSADFGTFPEILLPIGISFYTFQGLSYLADVYRGKSKAEPSLLRYCMYLSMFPQLIAGPIVTYDQVKSELYRRKITPQQAGHGLGTFIFGLGLKVLLANPLGKLWSQALTIGFESISTPLAWLAVIAYSFQLYFDFFGYSLMALGLGTMLGFRFPKNFDHPYTSVTMTEFWRRWHITLGSWFREYVYIPLGGSRHGTGKTIRNLLIVWLLTGIWHGAGYNFLLWGLILFLILLVEKLFLGKFLRKSRILGHLYMIVLIPLTWAVFAVTDIGQLGVLFTRLFPFFGQGIWSVFRYDYVKYWQQYWPFLLVALFFSTKLPYRILERCKHRWILWPVLAAIFAGSVYCMYRGFDDPFLYFRF